MYRNRGIIYITFLSTLLSTLLWAIHSRAEEVKKQPNLLNLNPSAFDLKNDLFESHTFFAPQVFLQSVQLFRHFIQPDEMDNNGILRRQADTTEPDVYVRQEPSKLSWNLGFAYGRTFSPAAGAFPNIVDYYFTGTGGLIWELSKPVTLRFDTSVDSMPTESYLHGVFAFRGEYDISFKKKIKAELRELENYAEGYDPQDARQYYRRIRDEKLKEKEDEFRKVSRMIAQQEEETSEEDRRTFPHLKIGLGLLLNQHLLQGRSFFRVSGWSPTSDRYLFHLGHALEVTYYHQPMLAFKATMILHLYTGNVNAFVQSLESNLGSRQAVWMTQGWSPFANQMLSFPFMTFDESVEWRINEKSRLNFGLNQTTYAEATQTFTLSFGPSYTRDFSKKWVGTLGAYLTLLGLAPNPGISGMLEVGYKL